MRTLASLSAVLAGTLLAAATAAATTISLDPVDATIHDILSVSAGFDSTYLYLSALFREGTFDPNNLGFVFLLDTDRSVSTGHLFLDPSTNRELGADFTVEYHRASDPPLIALIEQVPTGLGGVEVGTVPVVFGTDSVAVAVPLALVGNGATNFGLQVGTPLPSPPTAITFLNTDAAYSLDPATLISSAVPEPATRASLLIGITALALGLCFGNGRGLSRTYNHR